MQIIEKTLDEIHPYKYNPRDNDEAVPQVAASIREFGFKVPIVIDKKGVIVAGHTRYKAAQSLGMDSVPCIIADDLTDEQIKAFRLADNKVAEKATWNPGMLSDELKKICRIDMTEFGFDFKTDFNFQPEPEKEDSGYYGDERERTFSAYNLREFDPDRCVGPWQIPTLKPSQYVPEELIGFNYLLSTKRRDAGIHFYIDDYQFERIWSDPYTYIDKLTEFPCALTPNFSLYTDMPLAMQLWNTYRSRLIGQMMQDAGIEVIPSVVWTGSESYDFAFAGLQPGGVIAVETLGMQNEEDRQMWSDGMDEAIRRLDPSTVVCYGKPMKDYDFGSVQVKYIKAREGWSND